MFEVSPYHMTLAAIGVAIILAYWMPRFVSGREPAAAALLIGLGAVCFGLIPGVAAAISPILNPKPWEIATELCILFGLFGVGLRIDQLFSWKRWRPTIRLLLVAMPLTIISVALAGWAFAGLTFASALLLGAVLAPTDPVLAADVQVGPPLEAGQHQVRYTLTTEAGLNDGLAFPFVYLALVLAASAGFDAAEFGNWVLRDVIYRCVVGVGSGIILGRLLGKILFDWPRSNPLADTQSGVVALAGVLVVFGITELIEGYGFIAAFLAGVTLRRVEADHKFHVELHDFAQSLEHALTSLILLALGAALPVLIAPLTWRDAAIAGALIFIIRPIVASASLVRLGLRPRERKVIAFYGIRGIGSLYYLGYVGSHYGLDDASRIWAIVAFSILVSTIVHGFTAGIAVDRATGTKSPDNDDGSGTSDGAPS